MTDEIFADERCRRPATLGFPQLSEKRAFVRSDVWLHFLDCVYTTAHDDAIGTAHRQSKAALYRAM